MLSSSVRRTRKRSSRFFILLSTFFRVISRSIHFVRHPRCHTEVRCVRDPDTPPIFCCVRQPTCRKREYVPSRIVDITLRPSLSGNSTYSPCHFPPNDVPRGTISHRCPLHWMASPVQVMDFYYIFLFLLN